MALVFEEAKAKIIEFITSKAKMKSKFYFNDFTALFPEEKGRDVKKILTQMINEETLVFWSSGSTSMYGLSGAGKHADGED
ncbi:MAG: dissimilatory sulfite reductase D family protein [Humidesulfovibrio sp.]|nr:dissimilatory sulfite reductase D family protein [Humidesulfovibrio sp.]